VSFLLGSGPGILLLTLVASALVVGATMLAASVVLALVLGAIRLPREAQGTVSVPFMPAAACPSTVQRKV
jgi:hypothetical protein